jgi:hypothetical protein
MRLDIYDNNIHPSDTGLKFSREKRTNDLSLAG